MIASERNKSIVIILLVAISYFALGYVARSPVFAHGVVSAFWLPAAISVFAAWRFGFRAVPGVMLGQLGVGAFLGPVSLPFAILATLGNGVCAALQAWWFHRPRYAKGFFHKQNHVIAFVLLVPVSNLVSAVVGTFGVLASHAQGSPWAIFWPWWVGDIGAVLMLVPFLVELSLGLGLGMGRSQGRQNLVNFALLFVSFLVTVTIFLAVTYRLPQSIVFLTMPPLLWLAVRGDNKVTASGILLTVMVATIATIAGHGPFSLPDAPNALGQLQLFTTILCSTILIVASGVREREILFEQLLEEAQLLEHRVEERTEELKTKNIQLSKLSAQKSAFLGMAAHDLRSPLSGIVLTMDFINEEAGLEHLHQPIESVRKTALRMAELISRLLDVTAIEAGQREVQLGAIDVDWLVDQIRHEFSAQAEAKGLRLVVEVTEPVSGFQGDDVMVLEVLENLVSNAIKFTPVGPPEREIRLAVSPVDGSVQFEVSDAGPGFSEDDLKVAFQAFSKLSAKPTAQERSVGLGLFIVKELARSMGGVLVIENRSEGGARIRLTLPLAGVPVDIR